VSTLRFWGVQPHFLRIILQVGTPVKYLTLVQPVLDYPRRLGLMSRQRTELDITVLTFVVRLKVCILGTELATAKASVASTYPSLTLTLTYRWLNQWSLHVFL
jgi:hypothetical protein